MTWTKALPRSTSPAAEAAPLYKNLRRRGNERKGVRMRRSRSLGTMADGLAAVRKGPWTGEEDRVLVDYIAVNGEGSWNYLARAAGLHRTGKSCRLRWRNYLRPGLRRGKMTAEEQSLVVHLHSQWGNKWSKIATQLPGRTDNEVKNFWKTNIRQQQQKKRRRQRDKVNVTAAGLCSGVDTGDKCSPVTSTEAEGRSSSNSGGGGSTTGVHEVIVAHQLPSMCRSVSVKEGHLGDQQVPGGAAGGTWSAAAMDFHPELLLAASGENFWAIDEDDYFWSTTQWCLGNNYS